MGESGGRSGCLLTSSFMGTLALAFLSAESGRKVGQRAVGFTEGERKGEREGGRPEPNMGEQQDQSKRTTTRKALWVHSTLFPVHPHPSLAGREIPPGTVFLSCT